MRDILLREQSAQPDKIPATEWVFVNMKQLADCLQDALRIWHLNRIDLILACSMLCALQCNFRMYDYRAGTSRSAASLMGPPTTI
jgi:hypothetical protein